MAVAVTKHVVLFPFPAQGHLSAFMSVAALLHRAVPDAAITLVSTPRNVAALQAAAAASGSSFLGFHTLPFVPSDHGLPADVESLDAIPGARFVDFFEAFEALQPALDDYLASITTATAGAGVVVVVSDPFTAWTAAVARRRGCAAHALFVSCGAFGSAVLHSLWSHLPVRPDDPTGRVRLPEHPEVVIHRSKVSKYLLRAAAAASVSGEDRGALFLGRQIGQGYETDAVLINTVEEFEPAGLAMLRRTLKVPVWPVGPLVHVGDHRPVSPETDRAVLSFLDSHPPSSVLYVSFGSQHSIRAEHMAELAAALESTGRPFVWAVKPPDEHDGGTGELRAEWLPEGFEERARRSSRGLLVRGWAPQVRILAHPSTGTFLSHCGWNSVLESMAHGVPIVGWPLSGEQFYNAKMLEEDWGVCVEVARGNVEGTVVERRAVAGVVETVMGRTEKAAEMRRRAREVKAVMEASWREGGGSSSKALEEFLAAMKLK